MDIASLNGKTYFTSGMPDVEIATADPIAVTITCDGTAILQETLWPVSGEVRLTGLGEFLEPYARKQLVCTVVIAAGSSSASVTVLFAMCDVGQDAGDFYNTRFLTILEGDKVTAMGRRELLWYYGQTTASVTREFSDGTSDSVAAHAGTSNPHYTCIDASPSWYAHLTKTLVAYTVQAGQRTQRYVIDQDRPDCAPILEFYNSFGVWEQIYCTGTHKVAPEYQRSSARFNGTLRNYRIRETRKFEGDTGFLSQAMAITDSKSEVTNEDGDMPHFSFTYQYAQRIQNVLTPGRVGRIFDNTFDFTFN